jgi:hypothetical protein
MGVYTHALVVQTLVSVKLLVVAIATSGPLYSFLVMEKAREPGQKKGGSLLGGSNICVSDYGHEQLNHVKRSEEEKGSIMEKSSDVAVFFWKRYGCNRSSCCVGTTSTNNLLFHNF